MAPGDEVGMFGLRSHLRLHLESYRVEGWPVMRAAEVEQRRLCVHHVSGRKRSMRVARAVDALVPASGGTAARRLTGRFDIGVAACLGVMMRILSLGPEAKRQARMLRGQRALCRDGDLWSRPVELRCCCVLLRRVVVRVEHVERMLNVREMI